MTQRQWPRKKFSKNLLQAVVTHEAALRKQAQKMNVDSLRSNAVSTDLWFWSETWYFADEQNETEQNENIKLFLSHKNYKVYT
jgi:hypothetical protein